MDYYSRSPGESGVYQPLRDHLLNVAESAASAAAEAGLPGEMGRWAGLLHDLGKYSDEFQARLKGLTDNRVEHACHGATIALEAGALEVAFAVLAHHAGLQSPEALRELRTREERSATPVGRVVDRARALALRAAEDGVLGQGPPSSVPADYLSFELQTRLLLSCLVDADRLDAEAWMTAWKPALRRDVPELRACELLERVVTYADSLGSPTDNAAVASIRREVREAAVRAGRLQPGFFSMTVPTGGGKTLSSLAFALAHAAAHGHRRLIFVVPFLTVIEQNAAVIRRAVGSDELVLEHHSNVAVEDESEDAQGRRATLQRLLAENWDAPVIITTTVQFFESLFAARATALRKIHNIPRSVVVFDEAQTFPPGLVEPITSMLQQLSESYGCSFVFCTATQPAFDLELGDGRGRLLPARTIREIAPDPPDLFARMKRVRVAWPGEDPTSSLAVAAAMAAERQALAIVNTKLQALELFRALQAVGGYAFHLSTRMCAAHRSEVFARMRERLRLGQPCLAVSTQLIEAGVDIDFPAVWRALGPLDSIAQAAGRCNREGRLPWGRVIVYRPESDQMPGGAYRRAAEQTAVMLRAAGSLDINDPSAFREFFERHYRVSDLDVMDIQVRRRALEFREVDEHFSIVGKETTGVVVPFNDTARRLIDALAAGELLTSKDMRKLQHYTVPLYAAELTAAIGAGVVFEPGTSGVRVCRPEHYRADVGLVIPGREPED